MSHFYTLSTGERAKSCSSCKNIFVEHLSNHFGTCSFNKDGFAHACKDCQKLSCKRSRANLKAQGKETSGDRWQRENREASRLKGVRHRQKRPKAILLSQAKHRAEKQGIKFDLTTDDFEIPEICPYLGIPIIHNYGKGINHDRSPSLDRIDNTKGYIRGNVEVISYRANSLKADGSAKEHELIARKLRELGDES